MKALGWGCEAMEGDFQGTPTRSGPASGPVGDDVR
jgi:hypothetical protein